MSNFLSNIRAIYECTFEINKIKENMPKSVGRKVSTESQRNKRSKDQKNSTIKSLPKGGMGGNGKKDRKIVKKQRKKALLNLSLLYLYHV